ncbi:MAG: hypothetical protein ACOC3V_05635, partial [bacterium]
MYFDYIDDYNIILISRKILKNVPDYNKYLSNNVVKSYVNDNKINDELVDKYKSSDELIKLRGQLEKLLFDDEIDGLENEYEYIKDEIKNDMLNRSLVNATENTYYNFLFKELIDKIGDVLNSNKWPDSDNIYKIKDSKILFRINILGILSNIESFDDLMTHIGDEFVWEDIIQYIIAGNGRIDMEYTFERMSYQSPNKKEIN